MVAPLRRRARVGREQEQTQPRVRWSFYCPTVTAPHGVEKRTGRPARILIRRSSSYCADENNSPLAALVVPPLISAVPPNSSVPVCPPRAVVKPSTGETAVKVVPLTSNRSSAVEPLVPEVKPPDTRILPAPPSCVVWSWKRAADNVAALVVNVPFPAGLKTSIEATEIPESFFPPMRVTCPFGRRMAPCAARATFIAVRPAAQLVPGQENTPALKSSA